MGAVSFGEKVFECQRNGSRYHVSAHYAYVRTDRLRLMIKMLYFSVNEPLKNSRFSISWAWTGFQRGNTFVKIGDLLPCDTELTILKKVAYVTV